MELGLGKVSSVSDSTSVYKLFDLIFCPCLLQMGRNGRAAGWQLAAGWGQPAAGVQSTEPLLSGTEMEKG